METLSFVQGVLSVIGVFLVVGMVWAIKNINNIKSSVDIIYQQIDETQTHLQFRLDREIEDVHKTFRDVEVDLRSQMDSRFDKLINQVNQKTILKG